MILLFISSLLVLYLFFKVLIKKEWTLESEIVTLIAVNLLSGCIVTLFAILTWFINI